MERGFTMKAIHLKEQFFSDLAHFYPREEIGSFFNILSHHFLGLSRMDLALDPQKELTGTQLQNMQNALGRLQQHEPVQHITGTTEFYGLSFQVNKNVLIPRPETEELVQWILDDLHAKGMAAPRILDIGTGSGCIAISLAKKLPRAWVTAIDVSDRALELASENSRNNQVDVDFKRMDILEVEDLKEQYDVIVSNPPYVRELEKKEMQPNVLHFEPETALYVTDNDPLVFYRKITALANISLGALGLLYFEINQYLGEETEALLKQKNFRTYLKRDIFGVDRMLKGEKVEDHLS
jgi:release factor glutamine methyltransferase